MFVYAFKASGRIDHIAKSGVVEKVFTAKVTNCA